MSVTDILLVCLVVIASFAVAFLIYQASSLKRDLVVKLDNLESRLIDKELELRESGEIEEDNLENTDENDGL